MIEASKSLGCRGYGVELDPRLAAQAQARVDEAGLADLIEIVCGDAMAVNLAEADVVFGFVPPSAAGALSEFVVPQLKAGARLVMHEQLEIDWPLTPDLTRLVLSNAATHDTGDPSVTIAHLWKSPSLD